ncbi:energy-coupling factor ABC transporter ATP-binding protein [Chloroflexota bacterium]
MGSALNLKNLHYAYPDGHQALSGVDLAVETGESVGIVGPNGAGKSTLLLHLNGVLRSENGAVSVLGQPLTDENIRWVRSRVGLVFQDPDDQLFSPTVFDDVAFGPINMGCDEGKVRRLVSQSLAQVGLEGYEQRSSHHLSFGEKKRVSIATVLSMSCEILVLDEPTSNMDPAGKWALVELLKNLPVTRIVVSHELDVIRALCHKVFIVDKGRMVTSGPTKDILADNELLAAHGLAAPGQPVH